MRACVIVINVWPNYCSFYNKGIFRNRAAYHIGKPRGEKAATKQPSKPRQRLDVT